MSVVNDDKDALVTAPIAFEFRSVFGICEERSFVDSAHDTFGFAKVLPCGPIDGLVLAWCDFGFRVVDVVLNISLAVQDILQLEVTALRRTGVGQQGDCDWVGRHGGDVA